jgi:site-specific recombinase
MAFYTAHLPEKPELKHLKRSFGQLFQLIAGPTGSTPAQIGHRLDQLLEELVSDVSAGQRFSALWRFAAMHFRLTEALAHVGIPVEESLDAEFARRIRHRVLPPYHPARSGQAFFDLLVGGNQALSVIQAITPAQWEHLEGFIIQGRPEWACVFSSLAVRVWTLASRLTTSCSDEKEFIQPFEEMLRRALCKPEELANESLNNKALPELVKLCFFSLNKLEKSMANDSHVSLGFSYSLDRIRKLLRRMELLMTWHDGPASRLHIVKCLAQDLYHSRSPRHLLYENLGSLAYVISEYKSETGEHYITVTRADYWKFFLSACGGGVFAALMAFLKILIHALHPALFWQHFLYSLNYAAGFCGIQLSGSTLATKQPSMTAARLAADFDTNRNQHVTPKEIAFIFTRLWRSQFAAFAGNLLVVFPVALGIAWLWNMLSGRHLVYGEKALQLVREQNPIWAPVWYYASVTGVALFVSSVFAGYVENYLYVHRIPERLRQHPKLSLWISPLKLHRFSRFLTQEGGGLAGNILLGFLLGFPGFFANILGIDFDIRHITISTANYAMGIYALTWEEFLHDGLWPLLGIAIIGFLNFLVSFSLAFYVALRARNLSASAVPAVVREVLRYARRRPQDFWFPPRDPYSIRT